jgi:hypothetical protein
MLRPKPSFTLEDNSKYEFYSDTHELKVIIDEFNDNLLVMESPEVSEWTCCDCKDYCFRKRVCKHLLGCLNFLSSCGIKYREDNKSNEKTNV